MRTQMGFAKRTALTLILLALFVASLILSQLFLSMLDPLIKGKIAAVAVTLVIGAVCIPVLRVIYRPMSHWLRDVVQGSSSLLDRKAFASYALVFAFGFVVYVLFLTVCGLLLYLIGA